MTTTNDKLREALELGLEYVKDELLSHDNLYDEHPAGKAGRVLLVDHACQIEAALAALAQQAAPTPQGWKLTGHYKADVDKAKKDALSASPTAPEAEKHQQQAQEPEADHLCHNTLCVNPDHLREATFVQNQNNRRGYRPVTPAAQSAARP